MTYITYTVQGYDRFVPEQDTYFNALNVSVIAQSEEEAMQRASALVKKPFWRIIQVVEYLKP